MTHQHDPAIRQTREPESGTPAGIRFEWVDLIKAVAILWIFLNHASEKVFGFPYFANPGADWPPLAERIQQVAPLAGHGLWDLPLNLFRWLGWSGDQGVQLFLIMSGFGLTWGLLRKNAPDSLVLTAFLSRRLRRILPSWWAVHILALVAALAAGYTVLGDYRFYLSLLGIRVTPQLLYYLQPGWWYVGLLLQLYLVFPALWYILKRRGLARFFGYSIVIPVFVRLVGLLYFQEYLDAWSRGAVFITRLPEFALGMILASWIHVNPSLAVERLGRGATWMGGLGTYAAGVCASFFLSGMAVAPVLLGAGAFVVFFKPVVWLLDHAPMAIRPLLWTGKHSYALYLIHGFPLRFIVPDGLPPDNLVLAVKVILAFIVSCAGAFLLDAIIGRIPGLAAHTKEQ